jgi:hypothetical protein
MVSFGPVAAWQIWCHKKPQMQYAIQLCTVQLSGGMTVFALDYKRSFRPLAPASEVIRGRALHFFTICNSALNWVRMAALYFVLQSKSRLLCCSSAQKDSLIACLQLQGTVSSGIQNRALQSQ